MEGIAFNILMCIVSIIMLVIFISLYCDLKLKLRVQLVLDDIKTMYGIEYNKSNMKARVYHKYGTFGRFIKDIPIFRYDEEMNNIVSKRCNDEYLYSCIGAVHLFSDGHFNYALYDHCEKMMFEESNYERNYMRNCLNLLLINNRKYLTDTSYQKILLLLCRSLFFVDYTQERYAISLDNVLSYSKTTLNNMKKWCSECDKDKVDRLYDLYVSYLCCNFGNHNLFEKNYDTLYVEGNIPINNETKED